MPKHYLLLSSLAVLSAATALAAPPRPRNAAPQTAAKSRSSHLSPEQRRTLMPEPMFRPIAEGSDLATLGRQLFFDTTLSTPQGQSCGSCHAPEAGFRFPDSEANRKFGVPSGAIATRFGPRSTPTVAYAKFLPKGPPSAHFTGIPDGGEQLYIGGMFWDGHANDLAHQATFPFLNPNEMNNFVQGKPSIDLVIQRLRQSPNAALFRQVFGQDVFTQPVEAVYADLTQALAAYQETPAVSPFTSKFDLYLAGRTQLTAAELDGFRLFTGTWDGRSTGTPYRKNAMCRSCHIIPDDVSEGPYLFTEPAYLNLGVPRNERSPFYRQTNPNTNPAGYNPAGRDFVDYGLGAMLYPLNGLPPGNVGKGSNGYGDFLAINGNFKTPTLRNVDQRPAPNFVKSYMHNGVFETLKEVVHFYNARNLTSVPGEVIDFTQADPYASLQGQPEFRPPEVISLQSLENPQGLSPADGGEVGNLGLTVLEEEHLVAFLKTLSDGNFEPELPDFTRQPESATVPLGGAVSFTVAADAAPVPSYQWYRGDTALEDVFYIWGAHTTTLHIDAVFAEDAGDDYHCVATNTAGSRSSEYVSVTISSQPLQLAGN